MDRARSTGSRERVSMSEVAAVSGHSTSTVGRALLGQAGVATRTRARILEIAEELGYIRDGVRSDLRGTSSRTVGVYVRSARLSFYGELIDSLQEELERSDHRLAIASATGHGSGTRSFAELLAQRPDAIVVSSGRLADDLIRAAARQLPVVLLGRPAPAGSAISSVRDDGSGIVDLARRVVGAGHREVGVVCVPEHRSATLHPRSEAICAAVQRLGLEVTRVPLDDGADAPEHAALLAAARRVTAIMCPSDPIAIAAWEQLLGAGVAVPGAVSLTGYDGTGQLASPVLALTTWRQPSEALARAAVDLVKLALIGEPPSSVTLPGRFAPGATLAAVAPG